MSSPVPFSEAARSRLVRWISAIVGAEHVQHRKADRFVYGYDASIFRGSDVLAIAFPATAEEVAALVRLAAREGLPFVARGAGTGINGGALSQEAALVIELSRMNRILEVDLENRFAVVEPGVVNQDLKRYLQERGFGFNFVPDPGSQVVSTLGGNVGNNAGGMHCLKYGVTSNHIMGLQVVLPDGEIVEVGSKVPDRPGPDLTGLFVGSEGTLGIVTRITARILPLPEAVVTQLVLFPDVNAAARAVSGIMAAGVLPAALELLDRKSMTLVDRAVHIGYPENAGACLIVELDGIRDGMDSDVRRVSEICAAQNALSIQTAETEEESHRLWLSRRAAYGAMARVSANVYICDGSVPRNRLAEAIERVVEICTGHGLDVINLAHAGDGNLHPLIPLDPNDPDARERVIVAGREILEMCVELGGSITGEHGVGVEKQEEMALMFSPEELGAMLTLKFALDPDDRCNPRKIFPLALFPPRTLAAAENRLPRDAVS
ncbi:MAG: FAD-binding protein [SAR324 cluster bacterium]|nr:FAD-binding protein [SAR324 cluster bacterium]